MAGPAFWPISCYLQSNMRTFLPFTFRSTYAQFCHLFLIKVGYNDEETVSLCIR